MPLLLVVTGMKATPGYLLAGLLVPGRTTEIEKVPSVVLYVGDTLASPYKLALGILLAKVVDIWTDADHVRHSLLSQHKCKCSYVQT